MNKAIGYISVWGFSAVALVALSQTNNDTGFLLWVLFWVLLFGGGATSYIANDKCDK